MPRSVGFDRGPEVEVEVEEEGGQERWEGERPTMSPIFKVEGEGGKGEEGEGSCVGRCCCCCCCCCCLCRCCRCCC